MIYGYARVSTAGQSKDGNSLEDQTKALQAYGCQEIVTEAFSGKSMERPAFSMLFQKLQEGDTLVVTKLDRFARTAIDGVSAVRELFNRGVRVHILNMGLIENTLTGNLILTVMLAFAEYERGMIVERTQTGKAVARQDPAFRDGRPNIPSPSQPRISRPSSRLRISPIEFPACTAVGKTSGIWSWAETATQLETPRK